MLISVVAKSLVFKKKLCVMHNSDCKICILGMEMACFQGDGITIFENNLK